MTLSIGCSAMANAGFGPNFLDISPHYAGQLFGVSNTIANFAGILAPMVTGNILDDKTGEDAIPRWRLAFSTAACVYILALVLAAFFFPRQAYSGVELSDTALRVSF